MTESSQAEYRVLARKYRPQNFSELIGQDALVRTLTNAIESGRIAHAFMLTGVRGVGKTTTARIIAKALNYKGPDGSAGPTTGPTDDCALCQAISEDRHPDVLEMDAASRTGVDDIREILDGVRYAPSEARYKVYIIDEVHMLSKQAFNALLKTLEEPPKHVKFIFATTEIRKVPITVLSRCQRFDLRRVDVPTLSAHFLSICEQEGFSAEEEAIALISRAADGSVRDGLSLLDQAMALAGDKITAQQVQDMLGLADQNRTLDVLEKALTGALPEALDVLEDLYKSGADPLTLVQDLLDLTHILTKLRAVPESAGQKQALSSDQLERLSALSKELSMPTLGKTWQLLLKGLHEVQQAPNPMAAAEMLILRLSYAADLPDPGDLIKKIQSGELGGSSPASGTQMPQSSGAAPVASASSQATSQGASHNTADTPNASTSQVTTAQTSHPTQPTVAHYVKSNQGSGRASLRVVENDPEAAALQNADDVQQVIENIETLAHVVQVLEQAGEHLLAGQVYQFAHLVKLEQGRIEIRPADMAPPRLTQDLGQQLTKIMGERWVVSVSGAPGQPTMAEQAEAARQQEFANVLQMPVIKEIMALFPEAELTDIDDMKENED